MIPNFLKERKGEIMKKKKGFTLIELLIVVAIIAILAAIAVPNFLEAQTRSKVSRVQADLRTYATALETYLVDYNHYPPSADPNTGIWLPTMVDRLKRLTTPIAYLTSLYKDPFAISTLMTGPWSTYPEDWKLYLYAEIYFPLKAIRVIYYDDPTGGQNGPPRVWKMQSWGPDQKLNWMMPPLPDGLGYDSTNGTISAGDILRYGGTGTASKWN